MKLNSVLFPIMVVLAIIWFVITWMYISLEVYDVRAIPEGGYKLLHFREKFIELALIIGMFAFGYCLGGCFSSDRKKEEDLHGFVPKKGDNDDLKIIEGIGPKIEEVLNRGGITSFKQLKSASVTDLKLILAKGGKQFGLANPKTWPEQADLAHGGKWKELKEYQEFLVGGI